jgi:hypothetical protein
LPIARSGVEWAGAKVTIMGSSPESACARSIGCVLLVTAVAVVGFMSPTTPAAHATTRPLVALTHSYSPESTPSVKNLTNSPSVALAPISNFVATTFTDTSVNLSWRYPASSDFIGVVIRQRQGSIPPTTPTSGTAVANLNAPTQTYQASGLTASTKYSFAAFGYTSGPQYATGDNLEVTTAPGPVTSLTVSVSTASTIALSWSAPTGSNFDGVLIRRSTGPTAPATPTSGMLVARLARTTLSFTDDDLSPQTTFSYSLFSYDTSTHYSAPASATGATAHAHPTSIDACANSDMISTSQTWSPAAATNYAVGCSLTIESGVTLTVDPGTVVKLSAGEILVGSGATLNAGTAGEAPVIFTSYRDGAVGGAAPTGDGAPAKGDYMAGVELEEHSSASLINTVFRYGNASVADGLYVPCGNAGRVKLTLKNSLMLTPVMLGSCTSRGTASYTVSHNIFDVPSQYSPAFSFDNVSTDTLSMTGNWFDFAGTTGEAKAIWVNVPVGIDVAGPSDSNANTFAPGSGTTLVGVGGTVPAGLSWPVDLPLKVSLVGSALVADGTVTVGAGTTVGDASTGPLTLMVELTGTLAIDGSATTPVEMTNNSVIQVNGSGTADVTHAVFTGTYSTASSGFDIYEGSCQTGTETVDLQNSTFDNEVAFGQCTGGGASEDITIEQNLFQRPLGQTFLNLSSHETPMGQLTISGNVFAPTSVTSTSASEAALQVDGWPLQGIALAGASTNMFTGSGTDRVIRVAESDVPVNQTWEVNPAGGDVLMLVDTNYQSGPAVSIEGTVLVDPGTVVKINSGSGFFVNPDGTINVEGSATQKVVVTSFSDDSVGGDSNGDGPSTGIPAGQGGSYGAAIESNPDTTIDITYVTFRDGLYAVQPPYNVTPATGGSATISHSNFADELELGDTNGTQVPYVATVTNNTWTFDGATSGQFAAGGRYDPSAEQPAVLLANMDPSGFSLSGSTTNRFVGTGAGRVVALLGTTIAAGNLWTVNPTSGVVLAPWQDYDYLPNAGLDVEGGLTLMPGTVVKSNESGAGIEFAAGPEDSVAGVTFTAIADDTIDGDSNGDGSMSAPSIGAYGTALQVDENADVTVSGDTFKYALTAFDAPSGGGASVQSNTFSSNDTAVELITSPATSDAINGNVFNGNDYSIDATSTWIPFPSCLYLPTIDASGNSYAGGNSPLVSQANLTGLIDATEGLNEQQYPDGWVGDLAAGNSDFIEGWNYLPCDDPASGSDDSYTAIALPMDFKPPPSG